ncbi:Lcl C-terminal domain-containing protein [Desulfolutivibrio sp.]|uniref:Lcl C-terminal domain-containing protein n=1 Tax=Desulfolutivibrio sp. TaxID=2773296 RepID=UPI002F968271
MTRFIPFFLILITASASPLWAWTVPGTGQTACYNNTTLLPNCPFPGAVFYGQNGNYKKLHLFQDDGNGVVHDMVTKLPWQKVSELTTRNWNDAATYCENLAIGTYTNWRLPTIHELLTIVNNGKASPKFDSIFEGNPQGHYWSGSKVTPDSTGYAWAIDFGDGRTTSNEKTSTCVVRCVHGATLPSSVYVDNLDGTVTDQTTRIVWEKISSVSAMTWENALAYCESRTTGGHDDWRMPNIQELNSLADYSRIYPDPSIDPIFTVPSGQYESYWSSTTVLFSSDYYSLAWYITFDHGQAQYGIAKSTLIKVRCVRNLDTPASALPASFLLMN